MTIFLFMFRSIARCNEPRDRCGIRNSGRYGTRYYGGCSVREHVGAILVGLDVVY
jgi:hypothetical protein